MAGRDLPAMSGPAAGRNMPRMQMVSCLSRDGWCMTKGSMNRTCWGRSCRVAALAGALVDSSEIDRIEAEVGADRGPEALSRARNRRFRGIIVIFTTERPGVAPGADVRPTVA